jgi:hypothetical protein
MIEPRCAATDLRCGTGDARRERARQRSSEARELLREDDDSDFPNVRDLLSALSRVR